MSHDKKVKETGTKETYAGKGKNKEIRNNNSINKYGEFKKKSNI